MILDMTNVGHVILIDRLRALRLWHWQQAMKYRAYPRELEIKNIQSLRLVIKRYDSLAGHHLTAVQTLNEFFEIGDTAERDDHNEVQPSIGN